MLLAAAFALGILASHLATLPTIACLTFSAICAAVGIHAEARRRAGWATLFVALAFGGAGAARASLEARSVAANRVQRLYDDGVIESGDPVEVTGVLMSEPEPAPDGLYLMLRVEKIRFKELERAATGVVQFFAPLRDRGARSAYDTLELRYGARLRAAAALNRAESFRNPGVSSLTEFLERRGYDATAIIKSPLLIERLEDERVFLPLAWLYGWRQFLLAEINSRFSPETSGVLQATLLGNRHYLSRDTAERFREAGTFHVIVISGLHISFVGGLALVVVRRLTRRRGWQFIVSAALLWAYAVMVGAEASVVRAALMFTMIALAPVVSRRARPLNALGCAALLLLIWRPSELLDASFQLTFLSVLMMIIIAWPLLSRLREIGAWRPTQATPYPPVCPRSLRVLAEALFWSEREWQRELARATYSCRLFKTPLAARLERWHTQRPLRYALGAIVVSISVQAGLLPILILYFHRLSLASFILNIFVGLLMAAFSFVALAALLTAQVSSRLAAPLCWLVEQLNWLMTHAVDPFSQMGLAALRVPEYTGWPSIIYAIYYIPLITLAVALAGWDPLLQLRRNAAVSEAAESGARLRLTVWSAAAATSITLIVIIAHPWSANLTDGRLRIDFLDVGQGDAALVTMPDGATLLIDGGGRPRFSARRSAAAAPSADEAEPDAPFERDTRSIGEAVVSEYLWWRGLSEVDYILATHAHADHVDGLCDVARNFRVRAALAGRAPAAEPGFSDFAGALKRAGVPVYLLGRGDRLRFGPVEAQVLWPVKHTNESRAQSGNDDSLVLRLRYGERAFLLTGDIEREAEAALVAAPETLDADVVKVAHHGSRTSSTPEFVAQTRAKIAVISVGRSSVFNHPHREVVERWRASGAAVLTTGRSGTITISTDGRDLKVETFAPD